MEDYQERVIDEQEELSNRVERLSDFIGSTGYRDLEKQDRGLLGVQLIAMNEYNAVLLQRIARF